jgi:hypothetical protein
MLPLLEATAEHDWRDFATGDESWFFLQRAPKRMWILEKADLVEQSRLTIQARRLTFTIIWIPQGFYVVDSLPDGILTKTAAAFFPDGGTEQSPTSTLHVANWTVHRSRMTKCFMEQNGMENMPHPLDSPDLVPSDFFLFPLVKKGLIDSNVRTPTIFLKPSPRF